MSSDSGEFSGIIFVYFTLLLCFTGDILGATEFDFGTLTLSSLKLLGDAHLNNGSVRLTRDLAVPNSGAGRALYSKPIRFRRPETHYLASFSTFFSFSVTNLNPSSIGGGLAFVISPDDDTIGDAGGYLGLIDATGGPNGAVAVEFDTLMDVEFNDINGNHVGLDLNSMVSTQVSNLETIGIDLKSGDLVNSWIDYSGSTRVLNVSVSYSNLKPKEPLLSLSLDLDPYVETSPPSPPPPPTATLMNPTANSANPPPPSPPPTESNSTESNTTESHTSEKTNSLASEIIKIPKEFSYKELKLASKCFNSTRIIGHGAFGTVYKGILPESGDIVAVKRCSHIGQGDFGLARQTEHDKSPDATVAAGTMGYLAPEYLLTGRATDKTDVFSYGAVVLEVASGRRPIEKETSTNLVEWVWGLHRDGRLLVAADSRLGGEFDEGEMRRLLLVGLACSHPDPLARPTMRGVVQMLVGEAEVPIVPRAKPSVSFSTSHLLLSLQDSVSDLNGMITISTSSSSSDHGFNGGTTLV
ncbi:concanavalin A-like lectin protein kinase family protein [Actinidia rufa]|uniref:non-specific serine/threonine protein kinase n=1 Tax=Actinidia rufa TaxID=165716 RepID=A0A7J0GTW8_9ERIC|nr:concanavalin A-like lectin protein kinase family protein [Actinidia rufa]